MHSAGTELSESEEVLSPSSPRASNIYSAWTPDP